MGPRKKVAPPPIPLVIASDQLGDLTHWEEQLLAKLQLVKDVQVLMEQYSAMQAVHAIACGVASRRRCVLQRATSDAASLIAVPLFAPQDGKRPNPRIVVAKKPLPAQHQQPAAGASNNGSCVKLPSKLRLKRARQADAAAAAAHTVSTAAVDAGAAASAAAPSPHLSSESHPPQGSQGIAAQAPAAAAPSPAPASAPTPGTVDIKGASTAAGEAVRRRLAEQLRQRRLREEAAQAAEEERKRRAADAGGSGDDGGSGAALPSAVPAAGGGAAAGSSGEQPSPPTVKKRKGPGAPPGARQLSGDHAAVAGADSGDGWAGLPGRAAEEGDHAQDGQQRKRPRMLAFASKSPPPPARPKPPAQSKASISAAAAPAGKPAEVKQPAEGKPVAAAASAAAPPAPTAAPAVVAAAAAPAGKASKPAAGSGDPYAIDYSGFESPDSD